MGVRGLQTFLKENRQSLCRSVLLDADGKAARGTTPVVVDAWGIIYHLYLDSLPWTSGGEYYRFYRLTRRLIKAWRNVGIEPTFVFDGASPPEKHDTLLERLQQQVGTARMFYTISPQTHSAPSFSRDNVILPPFTLHTFSRALADMDVATHYVPSGEADGMCVVMAEEMGAYVFGRDTDFIVLASGVSENMKGYVPLDMMEWIEGSPSAEDTAGGWGFQAVKGGRKAPARLSRLFPPKSYRNPTLVLATYTASALCRRLRLPANLMPLFASLAGNDYTPSFASEAFFSGGTNAADRIERVARILREQQQIRATAATNHGDTAANLVQKVVRKLCVRPYVDDRLVNEIVDAIIEATIQYALPSSSQCCSLYPFCGDDSCPSVSRVTTPSNTPPEQSQSIAAYAAAQRRGELNTVTHIWLYPNRIYKWNVLEDPSGPCAHAGRVAIAARTSAYLFTEEALGELRFPAATSDQLEEIIQDHEVCQLLGVDDTEEAEAESTSVEAPAPRIITEYLRQGSSNRITAHTIQLPPALDNPVPTCLLPLNERLKTYLGGMGADTPAILALPRRLHPLVAVVRLCIAQAADADTTGVRRWRKPEIEAVLRAGIGCLEGWQDENEDDEVEGDYPLLTNRNAELVAQLAAGFASAQPLAQALLLSRTAAEDLTHQSPFVFFSGVALHYLLSGNEPPPSTRCGWRWSAAYKNGYHAALSAVLASLPADAVGSAPRPETKKKEKERKRTTVTRAPKGQGQGQGQNAPPAAGGRFALLMGAEY